MPDRRPAGRRLVCVVAVVTVAPLVGACSSATPKQAAGGASMPSSAVVATRWWSNSATSAGTTIDPANPQAVARRLHGSRSDYCSMMRQTVTAGRSILPEVTAADPALLASTKAFVAETEAVAPSTMTGPWKVVGGALIALVGTRGDLTKATRIDAAGVRAAVGAVAADAKHNCGVDLSSGIRH